MNHSLKEIIDNPKKYKICISCGLFSWHEKEKCHYCGSMVFMNKPKAIKQKAKDDFRYLIGKCGYTKEAAEGNRVDV